MPDPVRTLRATALFAVLVALPTTSCQSYQQRTEKAFRAFERGRLEEARDLYADGGLVDSRFLSGAEAGTAALAGGDWERAITHLSTAADEARELEDQGLLAPQSIEDDIAGWVINDAAQTYLGEGFERVYVHSMLALAYLATGSLDGVRIEVRRANQLLEHEEELYETEYRAGGIGHLVSALSYELEGKFDEAYIDYARMEQKGVGTALAGRALVRLANYLRYDDASRWESLYGPDVERPVDAASIVVVAGVGTGPTKIDSTLAVPTGDGIYQLSVPGYQVRNQPVYGLRLVLPDSDAAIRTDLVEDVETVAAENLEDRLAWSVAKSAVRGYLKLRLTEHLSDEYGAVGWLAGNLFTVATERADLRHWSTLPASWQAARLFVPAGEHRLVLEALGGESRELGRFRLVPGETMFVLARTIGPRLHAHPVGGERLSADTVPVLAGEASVP